MIGMTKINLDKPSQIWNTVKKQKPVNKTYRYIGRVGIALSVLFNVLTGGESNQTFSARNHEWKRQGRKNIVPIIDFIFKWHPEHCLQSWAYWRLRRGDSAVNEAIITLQNVRID